MNKDVTTIAIDLARDVFQVAYGDGQGRVLSRQRITSRRAFTLRLGKRHSRVTNRPDTTAINLDDTASRHTGRSWGVGRAD